MSEKRVKAYRHGLFAETVAAMHPYYVIRAIGGILFLIGALLMVYNVWKTVRMGAPVTEPIERPLGSAEARVSPAE